MPKLLTRIVTVLLVSCLLLSPAMAVVFGPNRIIARTSSDAENTIQVQALELSLVAAREHPPEQERISEQIQNLAASFTSDGMLIEVDGQKRVVVVGLQPTIIEILQELGLDPRNIKGITVTPKSAKGSPLAYPSHVVSKILQKQIRPEEQTVAIETGTPAEGVKSVYAHIREIHAQIQDPTKTMDAIEAVLKPGSLFRMVATEHQFLRLENILGRLRNRAAIDEKELQIGQSLIISVCSQTMAHIIGTQPTTDISLEERLTGLKQASRRIIHKVIANTNHAWWVDLKDWKSFIRAAWDEKDQRIDTRIREALLKYFENYFSEKEDFGRGGEDDIRTIHDRASAEEISALMRSTQEGLHELEMIAVNMMSRQERRFLTRTSSVLATLETLDAAQSKIDERDQRAIHKIIARDIEDEQRKLVIAQINRWWDQGFIPNGRWLETYQPAFFKAFVAPARLFPSAQALLGRTRVPVQFIQRTGGYIGTRRRIANRDKLKDIFDNYLVSDLGWASARKLYPDVYLACIYLFGSWKEGVSAFVEIGSISVDLGPTREQADQSLVPRLNELEALRTSRSTSSPTSHGPRASPGTGEKEHYRRNHRTAASLVGFGVDMNPYTIRRNSDRRGSGIPDGGDTEERERGLNAAIENIRHYYQISLDYLNAELIHIRLMVMRKRPSSEGMRFDDHLVEQKRRMENAENEWNAFKDTYRTSRELLELESPDVWHRLLPYIDELNAKHGAMNRDLLGTTGLYRALNDTVSPVTNISHLSLGYNDDSVRVVEQVVTAMATVATKFNEVFPPAAPAKPKPLPPSDRTKLMRRGDREGDDLPVPPAAPLPNLPARNGTKASWLASWKPLVEYSAQLGLLSVPAEVIEFLSAASDPAMKGPLIEKAGHLGQEERDFLPLDALYLDKYIPLFPLCEAFVLKLFERYKSDADLIFVGRGGDILFEMSRAIAAFDSSFKELFSHLFLIDYSIPKFNHPDAYVRTFLRDKLTRMGVSADLLVLVDMVKKTGETLETLHSLLIYAGITSDYWPRIETKAMGSGSGNAFFLGNTYNRGLDYRVTFRRGKLVQIYTSADKYRHQNYRSAKDLSGVRGAAYYAACRLLQMGVISIWAWSRVQHRSMQRNLNEAQRAA